MAIGREARRLARPLFVTAAVSLGSALTFWVLSFSSYLFDSVRSFLASGTVLIVVLAPGAFLMWLRSALRELELLPTRLESGGDEEEAPDEWEHQNDEEETAPGRAATWWDGAKARHDTLLVLWAHLSVFKDKLLQLGGPRRAVSFLAHPVSTYVVAVSLLATALLLLAATLSVLSNAMGLGGTGS